MHRLAVGILNILYLCASQQTDVLRLLREQEKLRPPDDKTREPSELPEGKRKPVVVPTPVPVVLPPGNSQVFGEDLQSQDQVDFVGNEGFKEIAAPTPGLFKVCIIFCTDAPRLLFC